MRTNGEGRPSSTSRHVSRLLSFAIAMMVLVIAISAWTFWHRDRFTITLFQPGPNILLRDIIDRADLPTKASGPVETIELDGTMPGQASQTLEVESGADGIVARVTHACEQLRLTAPSALDRSLEPDLICRGAWNAWSASIHLNTRCARTCEVTITASAI